MRIYVISALLALAVVGAAQSETCLEGRVFKECGSACERTCEDYLRSLIKDTFCTLQCVRGCFCEDGYFEDKRGACVEAETCQDSDPTCDKGDKECEIEKDVTKFEGLMKGFGRRIPVELLPTELRPTANNPFTGNIPLKPVPFAEDRTDRVKPPTRPNRPKGEDLPATSDPPDTEKPPSRPETPSGETLHPKPDRHEGTSPPRPDEKGSRPTRPRPDEKGGRPTRPRPDEKGGRPTRPRPDEKGGRPTRPRPDEKGGRPTRPDRRPDGDGRPSRPDRRPDEDRRNKRPF